MYKFRCHDPYDVGCKDCDDDEFDDDDADCYCE